MAKKIPPQIIGNIGLFHVCCELSKRELNVVPTARNTRSVDLIVGNPIFSSHATIQIKTSATAMGAGMGQGATHDEALEKSKIADFWVFVLLESNKPGNADVIDTRVCKGGDELLLVNGWFEPWSSRSEKVKSKWEQQSDDQGWELIETFLNRE